MEQKDLETEVILIKRDMLQYAQIFGKLDSALDRMSTVSIDINRLLSLHSEKIDNLQKADDHINQKFESSIKEAKIETKELNLKIEEVTRDLYRKIEKSHQEIISRLDTARASNKLDHENEKNQILAKIQEIDVKLNDANNRVIALERWRWLIIGGAFVISFIVSKIPYNVLISIFTG